MIFWASTYNRKMQPRKSQQGLLGPTKQPRGVLSPIQEMSRSGPGNFQIGYMPEQNYAVVRIELIQWDSIRRPRRASHVWFWSSFHHDCWQHHLRWKCKIIHKPSCVLLTNSKVHYRLTKDHIYPKDIVNKGRKLIVVRDCSDSHPDANGWRHGQEKQYCLVLQGRASHLEYTCAKNAGINNYHHPSN